MKPCTLICDTGVVLSEKFLLACCTGQWVVTEDYVRSSVRHRKLQDELKYEVSAVSLSSNSNVHHNPNISKEFLDCPRYWRNIITTTGLRPFAAWHAVIKIDNHIIRKILHRLLTAGGCQVLDYSCLVARDRPIYIFVNGSYSRRTICHLIGVQEFSVHLVIHYKYVNDYLQSCGKADIKQYCVPFAITNKKSFAEEPKSVTSCLELSLFNVKHIYPKHSNDSRSLRSRQKPEVSKSNIKKCSEEAKENRHINKPSNELKTLLTNNNTSVNYTQPCNRVRNDSSRRFDRTVECSRNSVSSSINDVSYTVQKASTTRSNTITEGSTIQSNTGNKARHTQNSIVNKPSTTQSNAVNKASTIESNTVKKDSVTQNSAVNTAQNHTVKTPRISEVFQPIVKLLRLEDMSEESIAVRCDSRQLKKPTDESLSRSLLRDLNSSAADNKASTLGSSPINCVNRTSSMNNNTVEFLQFLDVRSERKLCKSNINSENINTSIKSETLKNKFKKTTNSNGTDRLLESHTPKSINNSQTGRMMPCKRKSKEDTDHASNGYCQVVTQSPERCHDTSRRSDSQCITNSIKELIKFDIDEQLKVTKCELEPAELAPKRLRATKSVLNRNIVMESIDYSLDTNSSFVVPDLPLRLQVKQELMTPSLPPAVYIENDLEPWRSRLLSKVKTEEISELSYAMLSTLNDDSHDDMITNCSNVQQIPGISSELQNVLVSVVNREDITDKDVKFERNDNLKQSYQVVADPSNSMTHLAASEDLGRIICNGYSDVECGASKKYLSITNVQSLSSESSSFVPLSFKNKPTVNDTISRNSVAMVNLSDNIETSSSIYSAATSSNSTSYSVNHVTVDSDNLISNKNDLTEQPAGLLSRSLRTVRISKSSTDEEMGDHIVETSSDSQQTKDRLNYEVDQLLELWLKENRNTNAVHVLSSIVSYNHPPTPTTLICLVRRMMRKGAFSEISFERLCTVLRHLVSIHHPTSAASDSYVQSLTQNDESPWELLHVLFRKLLLINHSKPDEEIDAQYQADLMLLHYIIDIIENNFTAYEQCYQRDGDTKSSRCLCVQWIWKGENVHSQNFNQLISLLIDVAQCVDCPHRSMLMRQLQTVLGVLIDWCVVSCGVLISPPGPAHTLPERASTVCRALANRVIDAETSVEGLLYIVETMRADYMSISVLNYMLHRLVNLPDDLQVSDTNTGLSLQVIVKAYFKIDADLLLTKSNNETEKKFLQSSQPRIPTSSKGKSPLKDINKRDKKGETCLHIVCRGNKVEKLRELLKTPGIDVNAADNVGWTPLHEAVNHGSIECIEQLLQFKPQRNIMSYFSPSKPGRGGVNIAATNDEGTTPLHEAIQQNRVQAVTLLLQHAGEELLTVKNAEGLTPANYITSDAVREAIDAGLQSYEKKKKSCSSSVLFNFSNSPPPKYESSSKTDTALLPTQDELYLYLTLVVRLTSLYLKINQPLPCSDQRVLQDFDKHVDDFEQRLSRIYRAPTHEERFKAQFCYLRFFTDLNTL